MKFSFFFCFIFFFSISISTPESHAKKRVYLDIFSSKVRKVRIAISELKPLNYRKNLVGLRIAKLIQDDLERTGLFYIPDRNGYLESPIKQCLDVKCLKFQNWMNIIRVQSLVKGSVSIHGKRIKVDLSLFDILRKRRILKKWYRDSLSNWRSIAHRFANEVYERFTGDKGIFNTEIAFVSRRSIKDRGIIYIMDWDGTNLRRVTRNRMGNNAPSWSPDGRWLAFSSFKTKPPGVFLIPTNGGRQLQVSSRKAQAIGGSFSPANPTSRYFVYSELVGNRNPNYELVRYDLLRRIKRKLTNSWGIDVSPSYSPDGRKIVFNSSRHGNPHIYVMNSDGSNVNRITFKGKYNTEPVWSPRGDKIAYTGRIKRGKEIDIITMNTDGSSKRRLTGSQGRNESPTWSPDGRHISFSSDRSGRKYVYIMTESGTQLRKLQPGQEPDWAPLSR
tara:strand:+ start:5927 stop:7261 length:1335 start_codon:yes stop_codon:yes gene_type:complete